MLVTACGLIAASTVVMAAQAMALSRIKRANAAADDDADARVSDVAESISRNRAARGAGRDPERGERNGLRAGLLEGDGGGGGGKYGTSRSPLEGDAC
jgi:hypothetical protein